MRPFLACTSHRLAYYPIPKVASSLIKKVFCLAAGIGIGEKEESYIAFTRFRGERVPLPIGGKARLLLHGKANNTLAISQDRLNDFFVFTFVRNPLRRLVSAFVDNQLLVCRHLNKPPSDITFRDFVSSLARPDLAHQNPHWRPQVCFVDEMPSDSFIGRLEAFSMGWAHIQTETGFSFPASLTRRAFPATVESDVVDTWLADTSLPNLPRPPNWRAFYPTDLKTCVQQLYLEDLNRFGY